MQKCRYAVTRQPGRHLRHHSITALRHVTRNRRHAEPSSFTLYKPLVAETYATVTPDHVLHYHGVKDCDGKLIEQLEKGRPDADIGKRRLISVLPI